MCSSDLELGSVSRPYESGGRGVHTISTGKGDKGGVSYGEHQLASKTGTMSAFLKSEEGKPFAHHFQGMRPGSKPFNTASTGSEEVPMEPPAANTLSKFGKTKR